MPISPTNLPKNSPSTINQNKAFTASWGDAIATWGDILYAWGFGGQSVTNQTKYIPSGGFLQLQNDDFLLLQNGDLILLSSGGIVNIDKN